MIASDDRRSAAPRSAVPDKPGRAADASAGRQEIQFRCRKGIACWNACCSNIDISLTPYDILRLKHRLGITLDRVPRRVHRALRDGEGRHRRRQAAARSRAARACQFMTPEGCGVYEDRPTACRYYPVALLSMRRQDEYDRPRFLCAGEGSALPRPRRAARAHHRRLPRGTGPGGVRRARPRLAPADPEEEIAPGPTIGKPSKRSLQLFFMACYDIDRFRAFVASDGFAELFDLPADEMQKILADDAELMLFGFRFLRQVLFGEVDDSDPRGHRGAAPRAPCREAAPASSATRRSGSRARRKATSVSIDRGRRVASAHPVQGDRDAQCNDTRRIGGGDALFVAALGFRPGARLGR